MFGRLVFMALVKIDLLFNLDARFMARGSDAWANLLCNANELWPSYDGENRWRDCL